VSELSVEVEGEEIIVSRPGTGFSATYQKQDFVPKRSWADHRVVTPLYPSSAFERSMPQSTRRASWGWVV
jgi:hypothetical protein